MAWRQEGLRTRVKICGITSEADALAAASAGADAIGFIFWRQSGRYITPQAAGVIVAKLPPMITAVGVMVDPSQAEVAAIVEQSGVNLLQFHGDENAVLCEQSPRPYIKAVRVRSAEDVQHVARAHPAARGFLLDTYRKGLPGGTGEAFDWELIPDDFAPPVILAGGLNSDYVVQAIAAVRPFAVDVSGGVEVRSGVKDPQKIRNFVKEVERAQAI
jgi:phosphoribosylanthranilate isomerase